MNRTLTDDAPDILLAMELARRGASTAILMDLTVFGLRLVRKIVQGYGGNPIRAHNARTWFQQEPQRLIHGSLLLNAYERQPVSFSAGQRLLAAYDAYRGTAPQPGLLGIVHCYNLIQLHQKGAVVTRRCGQCRLPYLILSERKQCPVCYVVSRAFCLGCNRDLGVSDARLNVAKRYCEGCGPKKKRIRRNRNRLVMRTSTMPRYSGVVAPVILDDPGLPLVSGHRG